MDSKKLRYSLMMLFGIIAFGTCAYYFVEGMPLFEAFYMTIITISTGPTNYGRFFKTASGKPQGWAD